ncbi:MAG: glycosyl transferase family 2 protein [Chlamydiales bacterium]|nr:glycosyl transferase family 2 protein [Chlamydiales bacterium]
MISVHILTKNSEKYLKEVLKALSAFPEVLIVDSGSSDQTLNIARSFDNVKVIETTFNGFGKMHNFAAAHASFDWVLSIDSDEILEEGLAQEILSLSLDPGAAYSFQRHNVYRGEEIRYGSWGSDWQVRLYNRRKTLFTEALVHEGIICSELKVVPLKGAVRHYPYQNVSDFLKKMETYSSLFAEQYQGQRKSSLWKAISHAVWTFCKCYLLKRGFLSGENGFFIALYNAHTAYYKYMKLLEKNRS